MVKLIKTIMNLKVTKQVTRDSGPYEFASCLYSISDENGLVGRFEYHGDYAPFVIGETQYTIDIGLSFWLFLFLNKYRITANATNERVGSFLEIAPGIIDLKGEPKFNFKVVSPKFYDTYRETSLKQVFQLSNGKCEIIYDLDIESGDKEIYRRAFAGQIKISGEINLLAMFCGFYFIERKFQNMTPTDPNTSDY